MSVLSFSAFGAATDTPSLPSRPDFGAWVTGMMGLGADFGGVLNGGGKASPSCLLTRKIKIR